MSSQPRFHVREADSAAGDGDFIIAAFDSALPYLASIGSHEQWGLTPFSEREGWVAETMQQVKDAEAYQLTGEGDALRILILEAEIPASDDGTGSTPGVGVLETADKRHKLHSRIVPELGRNVLPVGFAFLREDDVPRYILTQEHIAIEEAERESCVYIEVMIVDRRVDNAMRRGAGAALIQGIEEFGRKRGKSCLFIDGWAGNDKKLIRYYIQQGFQALDDFSLSRKDKSPWNGTLMQMKISK